MIEYEVLGDLIEIRTNERQTLLHELVEMFSKQTPERLTSLDLALKAKNKDLIMRTAHTLRASCAYLGATEMTLLCADLERWGRDKNCHNMEEAQIYLSALEESYEESIGELKKYLEVLLH